MKIFRVNFLKFWKIRYICADMPKYIFNKETLTYEEYTYSGKLKVLRAFLLFAASIAAAFLYLWFYTSVLGYDLPKTALLKKTNDRLNSRLELLNRELDADAGYLASLVSEDDLSERTADSIIELLTLARAHGFEPDTKELQDAVYPYYSGSREAKCDDELLRNVSLTLNFQ